MSNDVHHLEKGAGEALIFLHGVGGDAHSWEFQLDSFASEYRAIAWDMPGYGGSPLIDPMTFDGLAEALVGLMDSLELERAHVVGHSMGGMVAQQAIAAHGERFQSLILSATSPAFGRPDGDFQKKFIEARMAPLDQGKPMADLAAEMVSGMMSEGTSDEAKALALDSMSKVSAETYRAAINCLVTFDRRDNLGLIDVPTLVLAGEIDNNAPAPMMEKMASKIPGAEYVCLAGAGHLANMEMPETFDQVLREFLTQNAGG